MLHIVNKSPLERNALDACLGAAPAGGAVLLIEDAVYAATKGTASAAKLSAAMPNLKIYALEPDLAARGMSGTAIDGVTLVDYAGFVDLVAEYKTCQSWL